MVAPRSKPSRDVRRSDSSDEVARETDGTQVQQVPIGSWWRLCWRSEPLEQLRVVRRRPCAGVCLFSSLPLDIHWEISQKKDRKRIMHANLIYLPTAVHCIGPRFIALRASFERYVSQLHLYLAAVVAFRLSAL